MTSSHTIGGQPGGSQVTSHHEHSPARVWPVDSDVGADDIVRPDHRALDLRRLSVVVVGGFAGGLARDEVVTHWSTKAGHFPWPIFVVNTAGAFVLGVLVIVVLDVLAESHYLRPLIGAGFCGALTTFSSVAVTTDQLLRHHHVATGLGYVLGSLAAGLVAAALGALAARSLPPTPARRRLESIAG
jgi:CrcB protein